jgi:hypothetical protein
MKSISGASAPLPTLPLIDSALPSARQTATPAIDKTQLAQAQGNSAKGPSVITIPGLTPGAKEPLKPSVYGIGGSFPIGLGWLIEKVGLDNVLRVLPPAVRKLPTEALNKLSARIGVLPGVPPDALSHPERLLKDAGVFVSVSLPGYPIAYAMVISPGKGGFIGGIAKIWPIGGMGADGMPNGLIFNNSYVGVTGLGTRDAHARHMPGYVAVLGRIPFSTEASGLLANSIRALGTVAEGADVVAAPETAGGSLAALPWIEALKQIVAGTIESATYYAGAGWGATTELRDLNDWRFNLGGKLVKPQDAIPEISRQWNLQSDETAQVVATGRYLPGAALRRMRNFDPRYTNLTAEASFLNNAITRAVAQGSVKREAVAAQWAGVLEGRINGGLAGRDLVAGKLLAATLLNRSADIERLTDQLYPARGRMPGPDEGIRPLGLRSAAPRALSNTAVGRVVAGQRVFDAVMVKADIGGRAGSSPAARQGALWRGRTQAGTPVYWLQGAQTNYILRDGAGQLITTQPKAEARARDYIKYAASTELRPLAPRFLSGHNASAATLANTRVVDGVTIVGKPSRLADVRGMRGGSGQALNGEVMWGRDLRGNAVFWLRAGPNNYLLRGADQRPITNQTDALARASALLKYGGISGKDPYYTDRVDHRVAHLGPRQVYDDGVAVAVGFPGQPWLGRAALFIDASGGYHAHTRTTNYDLRTTDRGTAEARLREWLTQDAMTGLYGQ